LRKITCAVFLFLISLLFCSCASSPESGPDAGLSAPEEITVQPALPPHGEISLPEETETNAALFDPATTGSSVRPQTVPDGVDFIYREPVAENEGWQYFISDLFYEDGEYQVLCRTDGSDLSELLFGIARNDEYMSSISYAEHSFEASGKTNLFFNVENGLSLHSSLWRFSISDERFAEVLPEPCSNMAVFPEPSDKTAGLGWIVYGDTITAVDLTEGSVRRDIFLDIDSMGDMSAISYSFFLAPDDAFKYTVLDTYGSEQLSIEVIVFSPAEESETRLLYRFDCANLTIRKI